MSSFEVGGNVLWQLILRNKKWKLQVTIFILWSLLWTYSVDPWGDLPQPPHPQKYRKFPNLKKSFFFCAHFWEIKSKWFTTQTSRWYPVKAIVILVLTLGCFVDPTVPHKSFSCLSSKYFIFSSALHRVQRILFTFHQFSSDQGTKATSFN